ncbi:MAG: HD domain-containing protein [Candidatus Omnitrophota bacterium]
MTPNIEKAIEVAIRIHGGQMRKGDGITPYVVHPISVAMILSRYTDDEGLLIAALLHDALEDTSYGEQNLEKDFGSKVLSMVKDVSDKRPQDPWSKRKDAYLKHLKSASKEACLIACADKINNLASICEAYEKYGDKIWKNFHASKEAKIGFYEAIHKEISKRLSHPIVKDLGYKLKEAKKVLGL